MDPTEPIYPTGQAASDGCACRARLSAYHDGELEPAAVAEVERHLAACAGCRAELEEIRELSSLAGMIGAEGMSPMGMRRIHQAIDAEPRFSIFRFAGILTGLAASALVVGSAWLFEVPEARPAAQQIVVVPDRQANWMTVASTLEVRPLPRTPWGVRYEQMLADARFSNWMVENLTGRYDGRNP